MKEPYSVLNFLKPLSLFLLLLVSTNSFGQWSIQIIDQDGNSLIGVEVFNENYTYTGVSDINGMVEFDNIPDQTTLYFKSLGFAPIKLTVSEIKSLQNTVKLVQENSFLDEVVLIGRNDIRKEELPYEIESINQEKIQFANPQTAADALQKNANVYVQKSQMGGGSPVVRGFEANKLLLVLDGVRMNNAIYRNGHLQNAITVDNAILERLEVIYGPGSLVYGSDALGGVIHFRTKEPKLVLSDKQSPISGNYYTRYSTANQEKTGHIDFNWGGKRIASLTSISYSDFGDLRAGNNRPSEYPDFGKRPEYVETTNGQDQIIQNDDSNVQVGTGYSQIDILQKFKFQLNTQQNIVANFQFSTSSDVPRYDRLIEYDNGQLKFAEWYYGPQTRFLSSLKYSLKTNNQSITIIPSFQKISEDRIDRRLGGSNTSHQEEDVDIFGLTADFQRNDTKIKLNYGLDFQWNGVKSTAYSKNIDSGQISFDELTRYPDGESSMLYSGAYFTASKDLLAKRLNINAGVRYTHSILNVEYENRDIIEWPQAFYDGLENQTNALTWSLGSKYFSKNGFEARALVATAFRSPNIDDTAKIRVKGGETTIPNVDLKPERSLSTELTLAQKLKNQSLNISATAFYTRLSDAIVRQDAVLPSGDNFIIDDGDTLFTVTNINAQKAYIYGFSFNATQDINAYWSWSGSINYTYGRSEESDQELPLAHIPPTYGRLSLAYSKEAYTIQAFYRYNFKKKAEDFEPSTDNLDLATPEGSLAWNTFNIHGQYNWKNLSFGLGIENIFDVHYRGFASGVSAPGRNLILKVSGKF